MVDVARVAGVSHQTVSRVLNSADTVRPDTRARVLAAMDELGYRRNLAARALVTRQSGLVGVLSGGSRLLGPTSTLGAIEAAARRRGYASLVGIVGDDAAETAELVDSFAARGVEGIIAIAARQGLAEAVAPVASTIPLVLVADVGRPVPGVHAVAVDQAAGARLATEHLLALGHRTIAHVAGPLDWFDARARVRGWRAALEAAGADGPLLVGDWSPASGHVAGAELLAGGLPDAVLCANDLTALGLIAVLREAGVDVPGRVSVVGYDDMVGSAYFSPALTTVRQPFDDLARACLDTLVGALGGVAPGVRLIAPELRVRASTAPRA